MTQEIRWRYLPLSDESVLPFLNNTFTADFLANGRSALGPKQDHCGNPKPCGAAPTHKIQKSYGYCVLMAV